MSDPVPADLADALAAAATRLGPFGRLQYFAEVTSTNDLALTLAGRGAASGTSVLADAQRAGRGRRGRDWFSPPGAGLYLSVIVRPEREAPDRSLHAKPLDLTSDSPPPRRLRGTLPRQVKCLPGLVTLAAGVALARAVQAATGLACELKWPNDLVTGRPWRKLAGVLCEASGVAGESLEAVVVGIGVNLRPAAYPADVAKRATSLELELSRPVDKPRLVVELLVALADVARRLRDGDRVWILNEWRRFGRAGLGGAPVRWNDRGTDRQGAARDIDADGALLVDVDGRRERLVAGDVTWERLSDG
jgi:BirA family biotin operon repressor/biotin-[acetyl-CoA-carboxylase] ligase